MLNRSFTPFPVLTTERLTLRQLTSSDECEIFTLRSDPEINKYLDRPVCNTKEAARDFIGQVAENTKRVGSIYWAITLSKTSRLIGTICLFDFSDEGMKCEMGYELLTGYQGMGIMKEAAEKVIDYAFST